MIDCKHWSALPIDGVGTCSLKTKRVSNGVCRNCVERVAGGSKVPIIDIEARRNKCSQCESMINIVDIDDVVYCEACRCPQKRVRLTQSCPQNRW